MSETLPTVTRHLPVPLTPERKAAIGEELAEHTFQMQRMEELKKELADRHTKAIKDAKATVKKLAELVHNGLEMKPVACSQTMDLDHNKLIVRRTDTNEIVEERALTPDDVDKHQDPTATLGDLIGKAKAEAAGVIDTMEDMQFEEVEPVSGIEASQPKED